MTTEDDRETLADGYAPALHESEDLSRNRLLARLPEEELELLRPLLQHMPLPVAMIVYEAHEPITHVYFVRSGVISMVADLHDGQVEIGTIGCEGFAGLPIVLGADTMPSRAFVQVPGDALRMSADDLRRVMEESPAIRRLLLRYALALFDQAAQNAACNRLHALEQRCARWLLMTHDRVDGDLLPLKQQFLAEMLGVHRPAVTVAAGSLQRAGMIRYSRGKVRVVDRPALEAAACECYAIIARRTGRLLGD
jgi:CRP-like cAMP-binding protein